MLTIVAIGTPLILGYTIFVYKTFSGKVKLDETSYRMEREENRMPLKS